MTKKIINGTLLLPDGDSFRTETADLLIKDGRIQAIGRIPEAAEPCEIIDAAGQLVMPGLINMHTHAYMTSMRNYADDVDFEEWLFRRVNPVEDCLPKEGAYWTSLLACMEMLRTGTTCFTDMHMFHEQSAKAADAAGMRAWIGRGLVGDDIYAEDNPRFREAIEEMEKYGSDRLHFILSPHAIYTCSLHMLEQIVEESEKRHMLRQTHLSEGITEVENCRKQYGGRTPVEVLRDVGFLGDHTIAAHCVQMQGDDIAILAETGTTVVTNPASNAKLGNGFAPVTKMREAGVNIALGTDGTASNNNLNMFEEMHLAAIIHDGYHRDPTLITDAEVLDMATVNGAKLQGRDDVGVLAVGKKADLIAIDLSRPHLYPNFDPLALLTCSAQAGDVCMTMVDGKILYENGEFLTLDAEKIKAQMRAAVARLYA